ncbi:MAG: AAA family ATPase, partial [Planctomycetota bacterium]
EIVRTTTYDVAEELKPVLGGREILGIQGIVRRVPVSDHVVDYALRLVRATRPAEEGAPEFVREWLSWGAGPRAAQYLVLAAKARAILTGRCTPECGDVRWAALPVLRHRLFTNFTADSEGVATSQIVERLLAEVAEPAESEYASASK